ncbi:polysaccharide biosynthesis C-terminal domain-containing protein [Candidatus Soleaferrea massiliensis]|uniref:oligosaccharide flippase family protein n=1 Tax=Candidatus Soleaferrea massiliensis TaxID=1470354 RepID=UPI000A5BD8A4|nr:oligosaccharide flippase family protein [Candidatus Soleaferrea massiliensis]
MNRYQSLIKNIFVFGIGTFSSKLLVFLLMPFYTRILTTADYGTVDLIVNTATLLYPVISVSIADGVIRYALEKSVDKKDVFSTGITTVLAGFLIFLLFIPVFMQIKIISQYTALIYLYVLMASLNSVCMQFTRSIGKVKLYAYSGFQSTAVLVILNVVFLAVFQWGIVGYVLSTIISDFVNTVFLFIAAKLGRYLKFRKINPKVRKAMIAFSVPLIPNSLFWWVTDVSDRYVVTFLCGLGANGLYSTAHKIPSMIAVLSTIFMQAWQISAITEYSKQDKSRFYTKVFYYYQSIIFVASSAIIMCIKLITTILVSDAYYDSWQYVPLLILAVAFQCFANFWGSIFMAAKKSRTTMVTTLIGAGMNIGLNFALVPFFGPNGAAFATFFSFVVVFFIRVIVSRKFIHVDIRPPLFFLNFALVLGQTVLMILEPPGWLIYQMAIFGATAVINFKPIFTNIQNLMQNRKNKQLK